MDTDTFKQLQETENRCRTYTEKSHTDLSNVISKLVAEIHVSLGKLTESVQASALLHNNIGHKIDSILENTKETNGRVHKLEIEVRKLDKDTEDRDSNLEKLIATNEAKMKGWVWRNLLIVALAGSFLWIKESRDVIIGLLRTLL